MDSVYHAKQKKFAQDTAFQKQVFREYIQDYHGHLTWIDTPILIRTDSVIENPPPKEWAMESVYYEIDLSGINSAFVIDSINACTTTWGVLKDKPDENFRGFRAYQSYMIDCKDNQPMKEGVVFQKQVAPCVLWIQLKGRENGEEVEKYIYQFWD